MRASFEMPKTSLFGMYAMAICEQGGCDAVSGQMVGHREGKKDSARDEEGGNSMGTNLARERDQMMFAQARNVDFANQNHLVMILRKDSTIDHVCARNVSPFSLWGCTTDARRRKEKKNGGVTTNLQDDLHSPWSSTSRPGHIVRVCEGGPLDQDLHQCTRARCAPPP